MSRSIRRQDPNARFTHSDDSDPSEPVRRTDPAWLTARSMLAGILAVHRQGLERYPVIVAVAPSSAWLDLIASAWRAHFDPIGDDPFLEGDDAATTATTLYLTLRDEPSNGAGTSRSRVRHRADVVLGQEGPGLRVQEFARALWQGRRVVAFTDDLTAVPHDLVEATELVIRVPPPSSENVLEAIAELTGSRPKRALTEDDAAQVTPHLLRLSTRRNQTSDAMVERLQSSLAHHHARSRVNVRPPSPRTAPDLCRLHGMPEAVEWGKALARDVTAYREGRLPWSAVDAGCLLSGPPGTGKTLFARALAQACDVPLEIGSYAIWQSAGHQGDFLRTMRKSFSDARAAAPSILFIDEIDSFPDRGKVSRQWGDYEIQVVNGFLAEIDGAEGREGVVLIGACNFPDKLDPALVRSGRLDRHIRLSLPSPEALAAILREHLGDDLVQVDLLPLATFAIGSSGADCERFVRGARRRARSCGRSMERDDLMAELVGTSNQDVGAIRVVALHEAGHVVAATNLRTYRVTSASLRAADGRLAGTMFKGIADGLVSAGDVHAHLVMLLAGRAAEEVVLGVASSAAGGGSNSDLALATALALNAISTLGLDDDHGLLWSGEVDAQRVPGILADDTDLARRVRAQLDRAYRDAKDLVARRREAVLAIADALVATGSLGAVAINALISDVETGGIP